MSATVRLCAAALLGVLGVAVTASGWSDRRPSLASVLRRLTREPAAPSPARAWAGSVAPLVRRIRFRPDVMADLRLVGRPAESHGALLAGVSVTAGVLPAIAAVVAQALGAVSLGFVVPIAVPVACAVAALLVAHSTMRARAAACRDDLRHQLSAYLDVVTMLLAANVGNEGALRQAASAGDGRLFVELRRRMLLAEAANRSLVVALAQLGDDLDLAELQQIAASAALGSTVGAPVARSLAAKCATLRATLAAAQETEARLRTDRITAPLVGMSLVIMAAVVYPALNVAP